MGTPHRGSKIAPAGNIIRGIVAAAGFDTNDRNIKALNFDSIESELSREEFTKDWKTGAFEVRTFQESQGMTGLKGFNGKVVSSCISYTLSSDVSDRSFLTSHHRWMTCENVLSILMPITWRCAVFKVVKLQATSKLLEK